MEGCATQHAVIDALETPLPTPLALLPWEFVISSIKITSRRSYISDVIGPLKTLRNLLKANFIMWEILWSNARPKNAELFKSNLIEPCYWKGSLYKA